MTLLLRWLFGCRHELTTFPRGTDPDCHVVCLDCGKEIPYSWSAMQRVA